MIGADVLERAVRGDGRAAKRLLDTRPLLRRPRPGVARRAPAADAGGDEDSASWQRSRAYAEEVFRPEEARLRLQLQEEAAAKTLLAASLPSARADHGGGTRLHVRAGAGVRPRRPRPPCRRPAVDPALPAPRRAHHLLRDRRSRARAGARSRRPGSSASGVPSATASEWRSSCGCGTRRRPSPSSRKRSGLRGRPRTTISRSSAPRA